MEYIQKTWQTGEKITADDLNNIENGIAVLSEEIANKTAVYIGAVQPTDGTLYWLDTSGSVAEALTYNVIAELTNVTMDNTAESVVEGASFAAVLTAAPDCVLTNVNITMGGKNITNAAYSNGSIYVASVIGDIVITASAREMTEEEKVYTITNNLVNVTSNNSAVSVTGNSTYTATLTAADGYTLDAVTVTMGGTNVTDSVYADGVITIPAVTGNVVITATSIEGVWEAVEVTNKGSNTLTLYSDDGTTEIVEVAKAHSHTAVFDTETEVKITLVMSAADYGTFYVGMNTAGSTTTGYYAETFGISDYPPKVGKTYERTYTVKAGYALMVCGWSNFSNIESLTVLKKV